MKMRLRGIGHWMSTIQGKLIMASLLVSLVPTAIAAELTVRLVTGVVDHDVQAFLHETSVYFLGNFKESQGEAASLARFLFDQKHPSATEPVVRADPAFLRLGETLGYGVVVVFQQSDRKILYSNYPVRGFEPLPSEVANSLYSLQLPGRTLVLTGGSFAYDVGDTKYEILVGNWLDENFIENLKSVTSLDLRLYYRRPEGFRMIYSSRSDAAVGTALPEDALTALNDGDDSYYDPQAEDGRFRVVYLPVRNARGELIGVMSSGLRATEVPSIWDLPVNILLSVFLTGAVLTAVAGLFVSRRLSRPLHALAAGVTSITAGNYNHRVAATGNDEIAELARVFNHMGERLGQLQAVEAELRRRDRLSALGEVAVGIAHEIRNPLGTIKTSAELVRKRQNLPAADVKLLGYVIDEVRRIDSLIEEFLSFARPRAPIMRPMPMSAVINRVGSFCEPELTRHGVQLTVSDASDGTLVNIDEDHIYQACLNLVLNAIDAMEGGGILSIHLSRVGDSVHAAFRDNGQGIPADIQEKIYNPFFTTKPHGTGLGLAKVFSVMESHCGRVECQSRPGEGTTFTLILPVSARKTLHVAHDSSGR
jgi:signal transduction histidine kinase